MLHISNNSISNQIDLSNFKSGKKIFKKEHHKLFRKFLLFFLLMLIITLFLPWTQNVSSTGNVTTLKPNQRPQTLQSQIPGRIEQWFVQEGDFVKKGDTILRISEVKSNYFDAKLAERTGNQLNSKSLSGKSYQNKISALKRQISAIKNEQKLKSEQAKNKLQQAYLKVKTDSIDLETVVLKQNIAKIQYDRTYTLQQEGLKATKDVEEKSAKLQEFSAKVISQKNKLLASKNNSINAKLAISGVIASYIDKLSKAQSSLYTAESGAYETEVQVSKLQTNLANYNKRSSLLYITAPLDGYINKAIKSGIGETFKQGEPLINMMPSQYDLAVEMYIKPIDLPLIHTNEKVRVQFDGWPAIVFSGWPNMSSGTYEAKIIAIENFISSNGKYRALIVPDNNEHPWPKAIRVGSGAKTIALLENVPIWYELWRQINSFPPNFYQPKNQKSTAKKKK
ncbi:HlyD family secretion protein [Tenacibaculum finnmarkense]|uniref:HlyD family secretion protein n=1 Tax=Tenacibaculum finnmarkense TaxID=2781243 RepID=UPI000C39C561|nr:biotin/lipoyl-binding protein [Tenacibaculum finnmarkense]MCD8440037.1 HlyD family secretion protein [Tenacibaculum finnmarkense genomovar ulcerans]MCG8721040.1 HlyD family efflux transporter periplasmic adaptor subunit [Tenacibaculum finnmarkense]SOS54963.1 Biotin attachment protein [Tenacibaculum finnmarkense]